VVAQRVRVFVGLLALVELVVFLLVAAWIGLGWTILATLATGALGWVLLARQGTRALADLRERLKDPAATHRSQAHGGTLHRGRAAGRELGNAGLVALGGLLMVLPGFFSDLVGLLLFLPVTRRPARALLARMVLSRLPVEVRGPVRVRSDRTAPVGGATRMDRPMVIEGEVVGEPDPGAPRS
jgi:UPF0716 protein FxsA